MVAVVLRLDRLLVSARVPGEVVTIMRKLGWGVAGTIGALISLCLILFLIVLAVSTIAQLGLLGVLIVAGAGYLYWTYCWK